MWRAADTGAADLRALPVADLHLRALPLRPHTHRRCARQGRAQEDGADCEVMRARLLDPRA
jgi:hypothetical protein